MKYIKLLALSLMLLVSYSLIGLDSKSHSASTTVPGDQIVAYYNTAETEATFIQMSNVDFANPLDLHIQVLDESCGEVNFSHTLSPGDTDLMILLEDTILIGDTLAAVPSVVTTATQGIVIISVVDGPGSLVPASSGNGNLAGSSWLIGVVGQDVSHLFNSVHRTLIGEEYELIQPANILSPFHVFDGDGSELVAVAWTDVYPGGQYIATSGSAATDTLLGLNIFNDSESPVSCLEFSFTCVIAAGVTTFLPSLLDLEVSDEQEIVCEKSSEDAGLVELNDITVSTNMFALHGMWNSFGSRGENGGMDYVIVLDDQPVVTPPPAVCGDDDNITPTACFTDICANNTNLCAGQGEDLGGQQAVNCNDFGEDGVAIDNDGNGQANCADFKCDTVQTADGICQFAGETNCTDEFDNDGNGLIDCLDTAACPEGTEACPAPGTSSSSGCSVAAATTGLGSMANALVLLIPAFGIGVRRIRRRLSK